MEWILFTEKEPDKIGRYLCYHWYNKTVMVSYWDGCKWEHGLNMTHWMELPPPPEFSTQVAINMGIAKLI